MKKLKLLTILAAATVVSASVYTSPVFATDTDINTESTIQSENIAEETSEEAEEEAAEEEVVAYSAEGVVSVTVSESGQANCVNPTFTVTNNGSSDVDLTTLKLKYYYTADFTDSDTDKSQSFNCYYAGTTNGNYQALTSSVKGTVESFTGDKADSVLVVSFTSGTLAPGQSMEVQTNVNKANWSNYDHSNDYSYNNAEGIIAEVNGTVVSGTIPGGSVTPPKQNQAKFTGASSATFDLYKPADINVGIDFDGTSLNSVTGLNSGDYTITASGIKINQSALTSLKKGDTKVLTLNFSEGNSLTFTINVIDTKPDDITSGLTVDFAAATAKPGDIIKVPVKVSGITANKLNGGLFKFKYDTSLFEAVDVTAGDICINPSKTFSKSVNATTGVVSVMYSDTGAGNEAIATDGVLCYVSLKVKDTAPNTTTKLTITDAGEFLDTADNDYKVTYNMGDITIKGDTDELFLDVNFAAGTVNEGETITVPVSVSGIASSKLNGGLFKFKYDTNLFEAVDVTAGDICINPSKTFSKSVNATTGVVSVMYSDTGAGNEAIATDGTLCYITLKAKAVDKDTTSKFTITDAGEFLDTADKDYNVTYNVGEITIKNVIENPDPDELFLDVNFAGGTVNEGETITVPVSVSGIAASKLNGGLFKFKYDTNLYEAVDVTAGDICINPSKTFSKSVNATTGVVSVMYSDTGAGNEAIATDGVLCYVTLKAKEVQADTTSKFVITNAGEFLDTADKEYTLTYNVGEITIKDTTPEPTPTPDPVELNLDVNFAGGTVNEGETITVPVSVSGIAASKLNGGLFKFKYDTNLYEAVSVTAGDICINPSKTFSKSVNATTGVVSVMYSDTGAGNEAIATDGTLCYITLKAKEVEKDTTSKFVITDAGEFLDTADKEYNVTYNIGEITIKDTTPEPTPTPDPVELNLDVNFASVTDAKPGDTISVPVSVSGIAASKLNGGLFKFKYDTNLFEDVTVTAGDICINPSKSFSKSVKKDTGVVTIMYSDTGSGNEAIATDGTFFTVNLKVKDTAPDTTTKFTITDAGEFLDIEDNEYKVNYNMGDIKITPDVVVDGIKAEVTSTSVKAGDTFTVDVNLTGDELADGIPGAQFYASYDSSKLELVSVEAGDIVKDASDFAYDASKAGKVAVTFIEGNFDESLYITNGGSLAKLTFKAKADAEGTTAITLDGDGVVLTDKDLNSIDNIPFTNGTVVIEAGEVPPVVDDGSLKSQITSATVKAGDTFTVDVKLSGDQLADGIPGAQFYASYDSSKLEVVSVEAGEIVKDASDFAYDTSKAGTIAATFIEGNFDESLYITNAGTLAKITFKVKANASGTTSVALTGDGIVLTDKDLNSIDNIPFTAGTITIA